MQESMKTWTWDAPFPCCIPVRPASGAFVRGRRNAGGHAVAIPLQDDAARAPPLSNRYTGASANRRESNMTITRIGDFEVQRITEFEGPFIAPETFFPDFDPE